MKSDLLTIYTKGTNLFSLGVGKYTKYSLPVGSRQLRSKCANLYIQANKYIDAHWSLGTNDWDITGRDPGSHYSHDTGADDFCGLITFTSFHVPVTRYFCGSHRQ